MSTTSEIASMSHVDLLDRFEAQAELSVPERETAPVRAEILRRMDSAGTATRDDIAPDAEGYQR